MKTKREKKVGIIVSFLALAVFALSGCGGSDGAAGAAGAAGPAGPEGEAGPVTLTQESCNVCHGTGATWDIAADAQHPVADPKLVVSNIVIASGAGATDTVNFDVFEDDGTTGIAGLTTDNVRFYMADQVPAGTATANAPVATWSTVELQRWMYERAASSSTVYPLGVLVDNGAGNYTYTFAADLAIGDVAAAPNFNIAHTQRLLLMVRDVTGFSREAAIVTFTIPADGADTGVLSQAEADLTRVIVTETACTNCHGSPLQNAAHGGSYQSPQGCVICHTPIGTTYGDEMQTDGAWLASLVHKIHSAIAMDAFPDRVTETGYAGVTYPKNIKDCAACHFDAGQDMATAWKSNPTIEACSTCHDVTFGASATHSGGTQTNATCAVCHPASGTGFGQSVTTAHVVTTLKAPDAAGNPVSITPVYTATITMTPPANGTHYVAGEAPLITVTTTASGAYDSTDNTTDYTAANLYVYGPRANAVPVLTTNSTTDPAYIAALAADHTALPTQSHSMLKTSTDPQVRTDATGFKYQLLAIPAADASEALEPGTYMVQVAIGHTSSRATGSRNYKIDGWAIKTFQVGTATAEKKVAGDGCTSCHTQADWGSMYHRSYFGTDGCLGCHDKSGNHADPLANRVHAVHAATEFGDFLSTTVDNTRDWSEITYPQDVTTCTSCHDSGNTSYKTEPKGWGSWGFACLGCHGDTAGAKDHMIQNGAPFAAH